MPNDTPPPTSVNLAIWGMHRSGTSLLCALLAKCGVHFGDPDQLVPANDENPNGFWENTRVRHLNDAMLMSAGCDWDHISRFNPANIPGEQLGEFAEESRSILEGLGGHSLSGIKEPRMCVLADAWAPLLADSADIFVYRHPAEIAKSLAMRNDIPYEVGLSLSEYYLVHLLNYLKSRDAIAVSHQELLQEPCKVVDRISAHIQALKGCSPLAIAESELAEVVDMDYYRARLEQEKLPEPLQRIWDNLEAEMSRPGKLCVAKTSIALLAGHEQRESEKAFLAIRQLRKTNRNQDQLLDQLGNDYSTAKAEINLLHKSMEQKNESIKSLKNDLEKAHSSNKEKRSAIEKRDIIITQQADGLKESKLIVAQQAKKLQEKERLVEETRNQFGSQLDELKKVSAIYENTLATSDDIVKILTALAAQLGKLTGRFFQVCLSAISTLAGLLGISRFRNIDKKIVNLTRDIDGLLERYEAQRAAGRKIRKNAGIQSSE